MNSSLPGQALSTALMDRAADLLVHIAGDADWHVAMPGNDRHNYARVPGRLPAPMPAPIWTDTVRAEQVSATRTAAPGLWPGRPTIEPSGKCYRMQPGIWYEQVPNRY